MNEFHEEDAQAPHQSEHQARADEHGSHQHPAPVSFWALSFTAAALGFGLLVGHVCEEECTKLRQREK